MTDPAEAESPRYWVKLYRAIPGTNTRWRPLQDLKFASSAAIENLELAIINLVNELAETCHCGRRVNGTYSQQKLCCLRCTSPEGGHTFFCDKRNAENLTRK